MYMEKNRLARETRDYRMRRIYDMSLRMTEEASLVLTYIYKACTNGGIEKSVKDVSLNEIARNTNLNSTKVRRELNILFVTGFVSRDTKKRDWRYSIEEDGLDALTYMLNEQIFPGRKAKFMAIIGAKKEGKEKC